MEKGKKNSISKKTTTKVKKGSTSSSANVKGTKRTKSNNSSSKKGKSTNITKNVPKTHVRGKGFVNQNEKEILATLREKRNHKKAIKIAITFFVIGILVCCIYLLFTLPYFNVSEFEIEGTNKYSKDEIVENVGLALNKNIFIEMIKGTYKNLNELSYIEKINLGYKYPNTMKIKVTERVSKYFAYDKEKDKFFRISVDGYILEESDISLKRKDEILVYAIAFDNEVILGSRINDIYLSKFNTYENIFNEFEKSGINGDITKVNFENSLTTITINDKLNVILPNDTNLSYNMSFLKGIIENIGEDAVGNIDMTKDNPTFSTF